MATITAAGIGSGLDVNSILEQIVEAERAPTENRLNLQEANLQAELSAFGTINSSINTFQSSLNKLSSASLFSSNVATVSNPDVFTATTSSISEAGNYSVEVRALAQSQALASIAFDELDDVIGTGTLTFNFGTTVYDPGTDFETGDDTYTSFTTNTERSSQSIIIDNTNNTVTGIRDAINQADIGVTASIVDDGSGFRLLINSAQQGVDNSLQIVVDEGGAPGDNIDTTGLSLLAFNNSATNVEQTQVAQDAEIAVNGLTVFRENNSITGAIPGVTLNLKKVDIGNPVQLTITSTDVSEALSNITNFVEGFNELAGVFNDLTVFDAENGQNGVLLGDTTSRNILQQIRRELGGVVDNGGRFNSLSSIGITTNRDGTLAIDSDTLNEALNEDFDSVAQIFYAAGNPSNSGVLFQSSSAATQAGSYRVSITSPATQGQLTGEAVAGPITIDANNDNFSLSIDGVSTGTLTLNQAAYADLDVLAQEIQNRINESAAIQNAGINVSVEYASGAFQVSSSNYGSNSSISVLSQNSSLGFTSNAVSTDGSDVVGSIGGLPANGSGQLLTGTGSASGLVLEILGNTVGSRGSVTFSRGLASGLDALLTQFLSDEGQLTAKTESIDKQIENIAEQRTSLIERVAEIEARLRSQFVALDVLLGQLQTTSTFLEQQLSSLPTIGQDN